MVHETYLGKSTLRVPRMGVGAMTWGDAKGLARLHPAKTAYGGAHGFEEEKRAFELSIESDVNLFDTAAMYSNGAAELRLGELARGKDAIIATKFPGGFSMKEEDLPKQLEASLKRLAGFHRVISASLSHAEHIHPDIDGSTGKCGRGGEGQGGGREQLFGRAVTGGACRACQTRNPAGVESGGVFAAESQT